MGTARDIIIAAWFGPTIRVDRHALCKCATRNENNLEDLEDEEVRLALMVAPYL